MQVYIIFRDGLGGDDMVDKIFTSKNNAIDYVIEHVLSNKKFRKHAQKYIHTYETEPYDK